MSALESMITSDLAALGDDSRRSLVEVDASLNAKNMYRDDAPGAKARRDELADARRRELAMMPLTISHIFAHRVARAAAGGAAILVSLVAAAMLAAPVLLKHMLNYVTPSILYLGDIEWAVMMTAIMLLVVYVIALWIAQSWFARRMRDAVRISDEPYRDLDALARGPLEVAQHAARRVDGYALGLTLGGFTMLLLVGGYVILILDAFNTDSSMFGSPITSALVKNVGALALPLVIAGVVALVLGREAHRRGGSACLDMLAHKFSLGVSLLLAGATTYLSLHTVVGIYARRFLPATGDRYMLAVCVALSLVGVGSWSLLWWRRREHARIGD